MRYSEIFEMIGDAEQLRVDAQKKQADSQMLAAKKAKQKAKHEELSLKQRQSAETLRKLNAGKP